MLWAHKLKKLKHLLKERDLKHKLRRTVNYHFVGNRMNTQFEPPLNVNDLFRMIDADKDGKIGDNDYKQFLLYTKLSSDTLSSIWSICCKNECYLNEFTNVLKLVSCAQSGEKVTKKLLNKKVYNNPSICCPFIVSRIDYIEMDNIFMEKKEKQSTFVNSLS